MKLLLFGEVVIRHHFIFYVMTITLLTLLIRSILCSFKALAIKNGEIDEIWESDENKWSKRKYGKIFKKSFWSSSGDIKIDDYWLPAFIGFFELSAFPLLMAKDLWVFIGAWIGIKTASSWGGWQKTRTAYNRFLLGNILSLGVSYLLALLFFKPWN